MTLLKNINPLGLHCCRTLTNNTIPELDESLPDIEETEIAANVQLAVETNNPEIRDPQELDKDQSEEPELPNGDGVPKQSKKRQQINKLSGESILKVFKRNSEERSKLLSSILDKPREQPKDQHPIDVFFQSMAMTVKQFSPPNQIRARMEICQIVSQLELAEINQAQNVPQHDARSSSASRDSTLPSPCPGYDARASSSASRESMYTIQSPSTLDEDYDLTLLN